LRGELREMFTKARDPPRPKALFDAFGGKLAFGLLVQRAPIDDEADATEALALCDRQNSIP
jgi:hypothetical protein